MRQFIFFLLFSLFYNPTIFAQKEIGKFEVGMNITSVLSSFIGNDNDIEPADVPFLLRIGAEKKFRIGFGLITKNNEFFDVISNSTRIIADAEFLTRLGFQKQIFSENRWSFYWGVDGVFGWQQEKAKSIFFAGNNEINNSKVSFGGGPLLGIGLNLSKRLYLSTEASIYGIGVYRTSSQSGTGIPSFSRNTFDFELNAVPPLFLYLNFKI